jgi:hypothetical protein
MIYLPYPSFVNSANCLDNDTLSDQLQSIYSNLKGDIYSEWLPYRQALLFYGIITADMLQEDYIAMSNEFDYSRLVYPPWYYDSNLHIQHRKLLLERSSYYRRYKW